LMSISNFGVCGIVACSFVLLLIYLGAFQSLGLDLFSQPAKIIQQSLVKI
jgi:hypothetical protein